MSNNTDSVKNFHGRYRGVVVDNLDPEFRGRLMCTVPDVLGIVPSSWCEASTPLAGPSGPSMGAYMVPPMGAGVWVEFEGGDPNKPIWTGCRFATSDPPKTALQGLPVSPSIVLQTMGQAGLTISDIPGVGGISLRTQSGRSSIELTDAGIKITCGLATIEMLPTGQISLNGPNLVIMK